jgi:hypothetical protein
MHHAFWIAVLFIALDLIKDLVLYTIISKWRKP